MRIDFYFDPACPWCWITFRWLTEVAPRRGLDLRWRPFSLLEKNRDSLAEDAAQTLTWTHGLLRLATAVEERHGPAAVAALYTAVGARIHHDRQTGFEAGPVLAGLGLDPELAAAVDDPTRDELIRASMAEGLELAGGEVGVPLIGFEGRAAYFGPIMSPAPTGEAALRLWDGLAVMAIVPGFFELKRSRDVGPRFGPRPDAGSAAVELTGRRPAPAERSASAPRG